MDRGQVAVDGEGHALTIWRRDQTVFTTSGDSRERALGPGRNPTLVAARAGPWRSRGNPRARSWSGPSG